MKISDIEVKREIRVLLLFLAMLTWGSFFSSASAAEGEFALADYSVNEVDFGQVTIGGTYTESVTVTNIGNADL